jgi:hypothetical protein
MMQAGGLTHNRLNREGETIPDEGMIAGLERLVAENNPLKDMGNR